MKLFRKWLSLLLVVILAAGIIGTASAADANFDVKDGIAIKYIGTATEITADMFTDEGVTTIGASCFNGKNITKVTMPNSVKSIQTIVSIQFAGFAPIPSLARSVVFRFRRR